MEMKAFSILIALFLISSLCPQHATADSCSSSLAANVISGIHFNTASLNCTAVWTDQSYILRYGQASSNVWSFLLSAPNTNRYIAIGFSPTGQMVGSSAIVGWVDSTGLGTLKQYALNGQSPSEVKVNEGDLVVVGSTNSIQSVSSTLYMGFQLNTSMPGNLLIFSLGYAGALPSSPSYTLSEHQYNTLAAQSIDYSTGQTETLKIPYAALKKNHGILNMLGWGILVVIGAIVARHCKEWDPIWFYSHIAIQTLGFILGVAGVATGLVLENKLSDAVLVHRHKVIGILILVLGCLQMMAALARPGKTSKHRKYWNWYHHNVGRILIIFAAANVFYGIHLGAPGRSWNVGYAIALVVLFIAIVVLEIRMLIRKRDGK